MDEVTGELELGAADTTKRWKLIRGYGGGPDTWCNSTASLPICDNHHDAQYHGSAPTECDGGYCLYELSTDPNERHDVSLSYPEVVSALRGKMDSALRSYSQYQIDPRCGAAVLANESHVGPSWQPWC